MTEPDASDIRRASIGYIGLGDMGGPMAVNLANAGYRVRVFDVRSEALEPAVAAGAEAASDVAEIARTCDVTLICVVYAEQLDEVVAGSDGLVAHGRPGQTIVVHSTVGPAAVERCDAVARERGIRIVDAPVTGGRPRSIAGELTIMLGGADGDIDRCMPLFDVIGSQIHRVGKVGDGQALKIINNAMGEVNRLIYLEALRIAAARAIPEPLVHEVITHGSGQSYSQVNIGRFDNRPTSHAHMPASERPYRFSKDLRHALELGLAGRLSLPITALASQLAPGIFEERWNAVALGRAGLTPGAPEGAR